MRVASAMVSGTICAATDDDSAPNAADTAALCKGISEPTDCKAPSAPDAMAQVFGTVVAVPFDDNTPSIDPALDVDV